MNRPTDGAQRTFVDVLNRLFNEQGEQLLQQPLKLEGWLRDLFPEHRSAVSCIMEGLHTEICYSNESVQDAAALLSMRAGLTPSWSDFSIRVWRGVLKNRVLEHQFERTITPEQNADVHTVDSVLSQYKVHRSTL